MTRHLLHASVAAIAVVLTSGCATEAAMREVAGSSAALVNGFKSETQSFVVRMNDLNDADMARLRRLAAQTQAMQIKSANAETAWTAIADDHALTMYGALAKSQPSEVIAGSAVLRSLIVDADSAPIAADTKQFDSLVQKLNALAAAPTFPQLVQSWLAFGKQVNDALKAEMKSAAGSLQDTSAKAAVTVVANPK